MKAKPIIFSGEMVQAILDGRKTQTRRVVNIPANSDKQWPDAGIGGGGYLKAHMTTDDTVQRLFCPYGRVGDLLWVRKDFMPKWASLITLEITGVRVERLQDISETDCRAEGRGNGGKPYGWFKSLWESINGKAAAKNWQANPWVWVIEFEVYLCNVAAFEKKGV
jgi:hypothetical protein